MLQSHVQYGAVCLGQLLKLLVLVFGALADVNVQKYALGNQLPVPVLHHLQFSQYPTGRSVFLADTVLEIHAVACLFQIVQLVQLHLVIRFGNQLLPLPDSVGPELLRLISQNPYALPVGILKHHTFPVQRLPLHDAAENRLEQLVVPAGLAFLFPVLLFQPLLGLHLGGNIPYHAQADISSILCLGKITRLIYIDILAVLFPDAVAHPIIPDFAKGVPDHPVHPFPVLGMDAVTHHALTVLAELFICISQTVQHPVIDIVQRKARFKVGAQHTSWDSLPQQLQGASAHAAGILLTYGFRKGKGKEFTLLLKISRHGRMDGCHFKPFRCADTGGSNAHTHGKVLAVGKYAHHSKPALHDGAVRGEAALLYIFPYNLVGIRVQ